MAASLMALSMVGTAAAGGSWSNETLPGQDPNAEVMAAGDGVAWAFGSVHTEVKCPNGKPCTYQRGPRGWETAPQPDLSRPMEATVVAKDDVWLVGEKENGGMVGSHWDGQGWRDFPIPMSDMYHELQGMSSSGPDDVWTVGTDNDESFLWYGVTAHWDGQAWKMVRIPKLKTNSVLADVDSLGSDDVWAVGSKGRPEGRDFALTLHWDGTQWNEVPVSDGDTGKSRSLNDVVALAPDDVWAVGATHTNADYHSVALHWDGKKWNRVDVPDIGALDAVSEGPGGIWTTGVRAGKCRMLRYDGTNWEPQPCPTPNPGDKATEVNQLAPIDEDSMLALRQPSVNPPVYDELLSVYQG